MFFVRLVPILFLLVASVTSFQTSLPRANLMATKEARLITSSRQTFTYRAASDDDSKSDSVESEEVTDLDKTSFDIAKEYAKTGLPEDSAVGGNQPDTFTM